ncbi:peptidoglycan-binding protein [[Clostridium] polysaccharolyticum]|uniref:peptidoglycan-binding protein n=1 Tax=[Clostridium] polysaccharolyticum TaxID=29364 RepID=UPI001FA91BFA
MFQEPDLPSGIGRLRVDITSILRAAPVIGVTVRVYNSGQTGTPLQEVTTDVIGRTPVMELPAPNIDYSLAPSAEQPYANYDLYIEVPGYESVEINNIEILPDVLAIQNISLIPLEDVQGESAELFVIPPHTLYGDYPPKIAEAEIKPVGQSGEIVLSKVVIPEYVVVHDGPPSDRSAANYYVKYRDYVKNVASSEIYATWPEATIIANVLCIQSFVLNRVYTEWYRNKGYQFTITNSTAFDQKYIAGRNIFDTISEIVDQIFANYISRPNIEQPLFTQFCDGRRVSCPRWLSQWGSKALGDQGYTAIDILRNYYGNDVYIATAEEVSGVPSSWPGTELAIGSRGDKVRQMQRQLNVISQGYPLIPKIAQDGIYGPKTAEAVRVFQQVFSLPQTGVVDFATWYKISEIYVGVSRIAELN